MVSPRNTKTVEISRKIFTDIAKRRQVNGSVATGSTALALYTGRYTARSLIISNPDTVTHWFQVLDGATVLIAKTNVGANALVSIADADLPFYTNVTFNSDSPVVVFTSGGFVP